MTDPQDTRISQQIQTLTSVRGADGGVATSRTWSMQYLGLTLIGRPALLFVLPLHWND